MGWLTRFTEWLKELFQDMWFAFMQWFVDSVIYVVEVVGDLFASAIEAIPVPDFLTSGLGTLFANLDPAVLYFVGLFRIPEGMAILGAGVAFRLLRKLFTLGQW